MWAQLMRSALCAGGGRAAERLRGRVARAGARDGDGTFESLECSLLFYVRESVCYGREQETHARR